MSVTADSIEGVPTTVDSNAWKALLGSAIGYAMDGFDLLILGFMLRTIAKDLGLSQAQSASLVTATLIGAVLGGIGFGMLSDRLGRVRVLTWTIVLFAVFTGLCAFARGYWDKRVDWFAGRRGSFYFHGLSGLVATAFKTYLAIRPRLGNHIRTLFGASSLDEQRAIYDERVAPAMWGPTFRWALSRQFTLSLLGVPHPQRREIEAQHSGGVAGYVRESLEYVLRQLPIWNNYFWRLYLHGRYTRSCCPEYLREGNFAALKDGLVDRIVPHTSTVTDFLRASDERVSKFVLLDHMDWMASHYPQALVDEWREILAHAAPSARVIFRSAHARPKYLDTISVDGVKLKQRLVFHEDLARELSRQDRVHTYAGFHICDVPA